MSLATSGPDILKCINLFFVCVYKQNRKCSIFLHWGGKHFPSSCKGCCQFTETKDRSKDNIYQLSRCTVFYKES